MTTAADVAHLLVDAAARDTPFVVEPTPTGAVVRWDISDPALIGAMSLGVGSRVASIDVKVDEAAQKYTRGMTMHEVGAGAGAGGLTYGRAVQKGTQYTKQTTIGVGVGPDGPGVVKSSYDTGDLIRFVDGVVEPTGLRRGMDTATRIGLYAGLGGVGFAILVVLIVVLVALL